jgi:hypothetical protein
VLDPDLVFDREEFDLQKPAAIFFMPKLHCNFGKVTEGRTTAIPVTHTGDLLPLQDLNLSSRQFLGPGANRSGQFLQNASVGSAGTFQHVK